MGEGALMSPSAEGIGVAGYALAAVAYLVFTALLTTVWRAKMKGSRLLPAVAGSTLWALLLASAAARGALPPLQWAGVEALRTALWFAFLLGILTGSGGRVGSWLKAACYGSVVLTALTGVLADVALAGADIDGTSLLFLLGLVQSILGLVLLEQVIRHTRQTQEWRVKFLWLGVGTFCVYDLLFYSVSFLYRQLNIELWLARGYVAALAVPLMAIGVMRLRSWQARLFMSPALAFYTTSVVLAGLYLLVMAFAGYYLRAVGGQWGVVLEIVFFAAAAVGLGVLLYSGSARARLRVLVAKYFFPYKYDYRNEWLGLTRQLSSGSADSPLAERTVEAFARLAKASGGGLWRVDNGELVPVAGRLWPAAGPEPQDRVFEEFIASREWIVDIGVARLDPTDSGRTPPVPGWLLTLPEAWLAVPLVHEGALVALVVLGEPLVPQRLTWEELDLLRTAGRQASSYLAFERAARDLAEAQQFAAFNRFAAFLMHDLNNLVAQQSLVVQNAAKHRHNPAFIDDAIETIDNSVKRMKGLLAQLKAGAEEGQRRLVSLDAVIAEVIARTADREPRPVAAEVSANTVVAVSRERLENALTHVVRNAQDATPAAGSVTLSLYTEGGFAVLVVADDGRGMEPEFLRTRLFRPFDSTKGTQGMGIGAFQVREFARLSGGSVQVDSAPGAGTRFAIRLPLAADADDR